MVMNAQYQFQVEQLGEPIYLDAPEEVVETTVDDVILAQVAIDCMWSYLSDRLP